MEPKTQVIILFGILILIVGFVLMSGNKTTPNIEKPKDEKAKELILKGMLFGANLTDYSYEFSDSFDGYTTYYSMNKSGDNGSVWIKNFLSEKRVYLLQNDTIICIKYGNKNETCSSVKDNKDLANYINSIRANFFSDRIVEKNRADMEYLIENGFVKINPNIITRSFSDSRICNEASYQIDYTNISVIDAGRFGIGPDSPKVFNLTICTNENKVVKKTLSYVFGEKAYNSVFEVFSLVPGSSEIQAPETTEGAVEILKEEKEQQLVIGRCYSATKEADKEKCISDLALNLRRSDMCALAGDRADRCYLSFIPITGDEKICSAISVLKDDCTIELAGYYKNSTYCSNIINNSKTDLCMMAAKK